MSKTGVESLLFGRRWAPRVDSRNRHWALTLQCHSKIGSFPDYSIDSETIHAFLGVNSGVVVFIRLSFGDARVTAWLVLFNQKKGDVFELHLRVSEPSHCFGQSSSWMN